ncbi:MAG TPA: hypothetical protein VFZ85_14300 [Jiangellaceae bacterium]
METWMLVIWLVLAALGYVVVVIGLAGLPMHARGRTRRIKWWAWVTMLAIGFVAVALGLGWFLVVAVSLTWATVALLTRTATSSPTELETETPADPSPAIDRADIRTASNEQLCTLWQQTGQQMTHTYLPSTLCSYADLRQAILDELTARDPDGVSRWLGDQPDRRDLRAYIHDHQA